MLVKLAPLPIFTPFFIQFIFQWVDKKWKSIVYISRLSRFSLFLAPSRFPAAATCPHVDNCPISMRILTVPPCILSNEIKKDCSFYWKPFWACRLTYKGERASLEGDVDWGSGRWVEVCRVKDRVRVGRKREFGSCTLNNHRLELEMKAIISSICETPTMKSKKREEKKSDINSNGDCFPTATRELRCENHQKPKFPRWRNQNISQISHCGFIILYCNNRKWLSVSYLCSVILSEGRLNHNNKAFSKNG